MRIYDKRVPTTVPFKGIQPGECFIDHDGDLNIKIDVSCYDGPNAVILNNGQPWVCDDDVQVIKVRAMVTIEE